MTDSLQKLRELGHDRIADEIAAGFKRWDDGLKWRRSSIPEAYLRGEMGLHVRIFGWIGGNGGISHSLSARNWRWWK